MLRVRDRHIHRDYDTRRIRYTINNACGVQAVFPEHGGGPLGIVILESLHLQSIVDICPLQIFCMLRKGSAPRVLAQGKLNVKGAESRGP